MLQLLRGAVFTFAKTQKQSLITACYTDTAQQHRVCCASAIPNFCAEQANTLTKRGEEGVTQLNQIKSEHQFPWNTSLAPHQPSLAPFFKETHIFT